MSLPVSGAAVEISTNFFKKSWLQGHLIRNFVLRDLKSRYVGSFMGIFWSVIHPIVLLICYTFVFSLVFKIRPYSTTTDNFAIFLFCGILPWLYFQDTVLRSCTSVVEHGHLIKKTLFPSEILPISYVISNLIMHLIGLGILVGVLIPMGLLDWTIIFLPVYLFLLMVMALGFGWLMACLQVFLRDTVQILNVALVFWFWFTPIFYAVEKVPEILQPLIRLNPLTSVVEGYRTVLLEHQLPDLSGLILLLVYAVSLFVIGGTAFRRTKREFVDVL
jgi:ABC-type polysaccharide/polyol phosphate export permease